MGEWNSAVLLYGMRIPRDSLEGDDLEAMEGWRDATFKRVEKAFDENEEGGLGKRWIDIDAGVYVHGAAYSYDNPEDFYVCCAFFQCDEESYLGIDDLPAIPPEKRASIKARLLKAIKAKISAGVEDPELRWYVMTDST
jgi:hypothetical protein